MIKMFDKLVQGVISGIGKAIFVFSGMMLYVQVNSYGHVGLVSSPNHTFFPVQACLSA